MSNTQRTKQPPQKPSSSQKIMESLVHRFESTVRRIIREEIEYALESQQQIIEESASRGGHYDDRRRPMRESAPRRPLQQKLLSKYAPSEDDFYASEYEDDYETAYKRPARAPMREQTQRTRTGLNPVAESVLLNDSHQGFIDGGKEGMDQKPIRLDRPEVVQQMDVIFREYEDYLL